MSSMFEVDPPVSVAQPTDLPTCMYKVDSFYSDHQQRNSHHGKQENSGKEEEMMEDIRQLEQRQVNLLAQLQDLKLKVNKIAQQHGVTIPEPEENAAVNVVITSSPNALPLSTVILQKLLVKRGRQCTFSTHLHSSFTSAIPSNTCKWLARYNTGVHTRRQGILISVMITNDDCPILKVDGVSHTAIVGDGNIARYLCRLFLPILYDDSDAVMSTEIDSLLDSIETSLLNGNNREQNATLRNINAKIGKSQWLLGDRVSLADIVLFSAVKQSGIAGSLPNNIQRWYKSCSDHDGFNELGHIL
ncbi:uncharacterized protein TRIADDRAFT_62144 [Trichoplax adhaerens]|uniref:AIMP2 thioredoxin-like domain-containing protein n=1 Tax=Trichoplax adhaerens TaxID=10228 RepID=B3SCY8_TRIAD|nr:hypothetical protein TRIADDRAFT_62144 [Trichoplax adhaerens]EDV19427.1 hypothetical protein TRIADDRAFT_62144 [Trichoplax adhaerens]|eukprot:XP_002118116.1 hypothetical protein TRIADDRAFT_62144 [Trichoplax adhaerens]